MSEEITTTTQTPSAPSDSTIQANALDGQNEKPVVINWPEDIPVCEEIQKEFLQLFSQFSLTSEQAQKLVDLESNFARLSRQQSEENLQQERAQWAQETKDFYGPKWEEEVSCAVRAADEFGGAPLRKLLEETGLGNHLVIVRTFNEIGKRIGEDSSAAGISNAQGDKTFAEALYGNLK